MRGRRAVVALTDGVDSSSNSDFATARMKLSRAGVACYFIQVNTEDFVEDRLMKDCQDDGQLALSQRQIQRYRELFFPKAKAENFNSFCQMGPFERMSISRELYNLARREMNDLARVSGGRSFVAATLADARAAFARVAADIGTLYSLGYYPTNKARDGKFRSIKLEVQRLERESTDSRARWILRAETIDHRCPHHPPFNRVLLIVLDGAGIGAMPDAPEWGDAGADTFGHILESRPVRLPNLQRYGLGNIRPLQALPPLDQLSGSYGRCALRSNGKDTTTGHWEMAGIILEHAFPTYPDGFPSSVIDQVC